MQWYLETGGESSVKSSNPIAGKNEDSVVVLKCAKEHWGINQYRTLGGDESTYRKPGCFSLGLREIFLRGKHLLRQGGGLLDISIASHRRLELTHRNSISSRAWAQSPDISQQPRVWSQYLHRWRCIVAFPQVPLHWRLCHFGAFIRIRPSSQYSYLSSVSGQLFVCWWGGRKGITCSQRFTCTRCAMEEHNQPIALPSNQIFLHHIQKLPLFWPFVGWANHYQRLDHILGLGR